MAKGSASAFPRFCFAFHLLHSGSRVLVDPCFFVECLKDVMAPAIWMCGGGQCDCDHHYVGTGFWDRGEMASLLRNKTSSLRLIVLTPFPFSGSDPFFQFQSRCSEREEITWRVAAPQQAQSAFLWSWSCISGSQGKGFQVKVLRGRCNSWMRATFSRNHAQAGGIGGENLDSKKGAAICGIGTRLAFWVGVSAGGSPTLSPPFYVHTYFRRKL